MFAPDFFDGKTRLTEQPQLQRARRVGRLFAKLVRIIARLRGENGCPWDREQTADSIKNNLVEEAFEALDAINSGQTDRIASELGDVLIQVVFQSQIAEEKGEFSVEDVLSAAAGKLVSRHPHVFGNTKLANSKEVLLRWEEMKREERGQDSVLADIPKSMPGFFQALVVQEKVGRVGFEWPDKKGVLAKLKEEMEELRSAIEKGDQASVRREYGDLLLVALNLGRYLGASPDDVLRDAVRRFEKRFRYVERELMKVGKRPNEVTLGLMDKLWEDSKLKGLD